MLRVINAQFFDNGMVTEQAFRLTKRDGNQLSVNQESKITPSEALEQKSAIIRARKESEGKPFTPPPVVARMTVGEIEGIPLVAEDGELHDAEQSALSVWDDSMLEGTPDSHAYIPRMACSLSHDLRVCCLCWSRGFMWARWSLVAMWSLVARVFLRDGCGTGRAAGLLRALYIEPRAHRISVFSVTFSRLLLNQVAR